MIRADDRTPEERRADRRAEIDAELDAMTEEDVERLLKKTIGVLINLGRADCAKAVMKLTKMMEDARADLYNALYDR